MKTDRPSTRAGFTIIELLIVILLMAIMLSILVSLVQGIMGTSRYAATKSTIIKISRMMGDRTEAFHRYMDKLDKRAGRRAGEVGFPRYVKMRHWQQAGGRNKLALILARKDEFRRHFPQMFSEDDLTLTDKNWPQNDPNAYISEDKNGNGTLDPGEDLNNDGQLDLNLYLPDIFHDSITESSECLYYFLIQGETFGAEQIGADAFTSREVMDTDGDGLLEFVDSWENPLRFYRWPTRLIRPGPAIISTDVQKIVDDSDSIFGLDREFAFRIDEKAALVIFGPLPPRPRFPPPNQDLTSRLPFPDDGITYNDPTIRTELEDPLAQDGDDPLGLTFRWSNTSNLPRFDQLMSPENFEERYHTPSTYHAPLILSTGPDGELGMYEPTEGDFIPDPTDSFERRYDDTNFGRLAQPKNISTTSNTLVVDPALFDNISNIFLRSGVAR